MKSIRSITQLKLIALVGLCLLSVVVVELHRGSPAVGYEISVYEAYPWYVWGSLIGAAVLGQGIILETIRRGQRESTFWPIGAGLILLVTTILLFLPYIRGYPIYGRADLLTHLGLIHDLSEVGVDGNIYPLTHVLTYVLSHAMGAEPSAVINLLAPVFSFVFFAGLWYTVVFVFEKRSIALLSLPFVLVPIATAFHVDVAPYELSALYVPFVLYLFASRDRTESMSIRIALVLSLIGLVLYHPLTAAFVIIVFATYSAIKWVPSTDAKRRSPTVILPLTVVVFVAWYLNSVGVVRRFEYVIQSLLGGGGGETQVDTYSETLSTYSPSILDLLTIGFYQYGIEALLFPFAGGYLLFVGTQWVRQGKQPSTIDLWFGSAFLCFTAISGVFFITDLIASAQRPLLFAKIFAVLLGVSLFSRLYQEVDDSTRRAIITVSLGVTLIALAALTVLSVYPSTQGTDTNHQVTEAEIEGTAWLFENRDEELRIDEIGIRQFRFDHLHHGTINTSETIREEGTSPPFRFGYEDNETVGESYSEDRYMIITELGKRSYPEQFPAYRDFWRYTPENFERLESDRSVSRVYANGDLELYRIEGAEST